MIVRPARQADLQCITKILTECDLVREQNMAEFTGITLVAERGGEVIGFAQALPGKPISYFALLAVLPAYQKTRAAYKLVEGIELLLRASGCLEWAAFIDESAASWQSTVEHWGAIANPNPGRLFRKDL